jgi:hypothetical protein
MKGTAVLLFMVIIFLTHSASSQRVESQHEVSFRISASRMDVFQGFSYQFSQKKWSQEAILDWGINKSFLQRRFYPRLTLGASYDLVDKKLISLAPMITYGYALLQLNKPNNRWNQWHEFYAGIRFSVGHSWRFIFACSAGWLMEQYYSTLLEKQTLAQSFGWNGSFGIGYAW